MIFWKYEMNDSDNNMHKIAKKAKKILKIRGFYKVLFQLKEDPNFLNAPATQRAFFGAPII